MLKPKTLEQANESNNEWLDVNDLKMKKGVSFESKLVFVRFILTKEE